MADGNLVPIEIRVTTPGNQADIDARMALNDARMLPEAVSPKTCIIVGSGPSARSAALWERLQRESITTVACNGALSLFLERKLEPTYWACCDPQDETLAFLPEHPPHGVQYLLATKCPESLFQKLQDHDVRVWRLDDMNHTPNTLHVPCAVSITLVTQNLMRFMGFHRFEMYGWDCCYLNGEHHASTQPEPEDPIDFELRDEQTNNLLHAFKVVPQWIAELNDATIQAHNYRAMGYEMIVHGPGAVATLLRAKGLIA